jgi:hypothetical protein
LDQRDSTRPVLPEKIFPFALTPNHIHISRHPVPHEGRFAIVTDVGTGCGGRGGGARRAALIRLPKNFGGTVPKPPGAFAEGVRGRRSRVDYILVFGETRRSKENPLKQAFLR